MIDINKKYRTRDGREVRIYATDGRGIYPVHGAVKVEDGWIPYTWQEIGVEGVNNARDLIEVRPRHKRTVWFNVFKNVEHGGYENKLEADICAGTDRIACIKVELDFEEGEGL
jgi:hypothetical protein